MTMGKRASEKRRPAKIRAPRAGLPAKDSVREVVPKVSETGLRFRILKTTEMNGYDKPRDRKKPK